VALRVECRSEIEYAQAPRAWMDNDRRNVVRRVIAEYYSPEGKNFLVETERNERYLLRYRFMEDIWTVILKEKEGNTRT
jgi:hypothetical protein